ncbi:transglycosylase family protein [Streptomyces sp. NPDC046985]|uniref:transglycosylase family protein n=1 Tax=Streptomyces sp. NPDC046985 TaxID=3155377 RepID=UPI0033EB67F9
MLSGNGRHRRPRQAPAIVVAAGVTGSALALPLLGASGASAADGTTWDKVAECETGGSWSTDTGNGYYGGLQLTQDDWEKYGGLDYASRADQASRSQQIAVAEKILADRGPGAWPACGLLSGLTVSSGAAPVDTGVGGGSSADSGSSGGSGSSDADPGPSDSSHTGTGSTDSSGSSGSSGSSTPSGAPGTASGPSGSADSGKTSSSTGSSPGTADRQAESGTSGASGAPGASGTGGGRIPGEAGSVSRGAERGYSGYSADSDNSQQSIGSSALVDTGALDAGTLGAGRHRGGSAAEDLKQDSVTSAGGRHASRVADGAYTVREGETLASIADSLGVPGGWRALYHANEGVLGADPDHVMAGQTLDLPA